MQNNNELFISNNFIKPDDPVYLCIVMPAYNEGERIRKNLLKTSDIISKFIKNYQIIAINDGSSDNTEAEIKEASLINSKIAYISYFPNQGKGNAIATGVKYAHSHYIAFLDSDLELDPSMLKNFLKTLIDSNADIAIGSKMHKKSKLDYPISRRILSLGYYMLLKLLFRLNLKDTQTGIKLFKSSIIKPICDNLTTTGFAFDIEILAKANQQGAKIIEMPIELKFSRNRHEKSRISVKQIINMFKDTLNIKKALKKD